MKNTLFYLVPLLQILWVRSLQDVLIKAIEYAKSKGVDFVDVRVEKLEKNTLSIQDGIVKELKTGYEEGAAIRVLYKGAWGFSSTNKITLQELVKAIDNAIIAARALSVKTKKPIKIVELSSKTDYIKLKLRKDPRSVSIEEKLRDYLEYESMLRKRDYVKTSTVNYADIVGVKYYASSEDRYIEQELSITWMYTWITGRIGDVTASVRDERGSIEGYVIWDKWDMNEIVELVTSRLWKQLKAKTPKGGAYPAVLAPEIVGVFVHEAFGHLAEADLTMSGSAVSDKLGKEIASPLVTIVDDPTIHGGFGTFKYDDEGVETRPAVLIENGVVRELMVDRYYAKILNIKPTGNARAESYKVPPLIRMRNTILKPRDYSKDELFEGIDFGYYLVSFRGGQANLDGTFQVGVQEAYEIVKGEIGEPVRNMSISGNTLDTLKMVDAVGKDFEIGFGRCGKGQTAFVSDGGPHVRVRKIIVGGVA